MANEGSLVSSVGSKIGEVLIKQIGRQLGFVTHYKRNIENLMKQVEKLKTKRSGLQQLVCAAIDNGDNIGSDVQKWLKSVDELCLYATNFYEGEVKENNGCLKGWCPNLKAYYTLSKKATTKEKEAVELLKEVPDRISYPGPPLPIGFTSVADFKRFESRVPIINNIMNHLKGDEVSMIGICGMGGVGKTTMVEEITRRVRDEKLFDGITMAVVSQNMDTMKIQDEIAFHLGLKLEEKSAISNVRANYLCKRLMQSSNGNLIILDDLWESIDLKEIGIPYGGENNKCKIVLMSRNADVCRVQGCEMIFKVEALSEQEAWSLFRDMAGDCVDAPDLYLTASKVARECGGLPIAVITLGKALNDKSKEVWDDALNQLTKSVIPTTLPEVESKVHRSLQLSYDYLESKEAKSIFLLCCLFPEDKNIHLEDLVRYGVGLRFFDGIDLITQARDRVLALTMKLKSCFLLLDGQARFYVKLHDVVRDVGISIGSKDQENNFNMKMIHGGEWPKVRDDAYKDCSALSVISDKIRDLPSEGLDFPNLEVLQLACRDLSLEAPNSRNIFGGMTRLRVLDMWDMHSQSLPSFVVLLKQLRVLCWNDYRRFEEICDFSKELPSLEILSIGYYPENIECLTNLRLLDLRRCGSILIPPSVFSCLHALEDLHAGDWKPAEEGDKRGNASFNELVSLSKLTSLVILFPHARFLPKIPFLKKLNRYILDVGGNYGLVSDRKKYNSKNCFLKKSLYLQAGCDEDAVLGGGIDYLLKQSTETLTLRGDGLKTVFDQLFQGGSAHLRKLDISRCNEGIEYLVDTSRAEIGGFPKLEKLRLDDVRSLKEICHGQQLHVQLSNLRVVRVYRCLALKNLFTASVARSLVNLESLRIFEAKMEEVIINQGPTGATERDGVELADIQKIEFPKLMELSLINLPNLTCFSKGIDHISLPQLTDLSIGGLPNLKSLLPQGNSNEALEDNHTVQLQTSFNNKVTYPSLEKLLLTSFHNMEELWCSQIPTGSFRKVRVLKVHHCTKLVNIIPSHLFKVLSSLEELEVSECGSLEELFDSKEANIEGVYHATLIETLKSIKVSECSHIRNIFPSSIAQGLVNLQLLEVESCPMIEKIYMEKADKDGGEDKTLFPALKMLTLSWLPRLKSFFNVNYTIQLPVLNEVYIFDCYKMTTFSSSFVSTPKLHGVCFSTEYKFVWMVNLNKTIEQVFERKIEIHDYDSDETDCDIREH